MRVLFWGSPEFAVSPLEAILASPHQEVVGVVCQPDRPRGRGRKVSEVAVKRIARSRGLRALQPEIPKGEEFIAELKALEPDISVVAAYGHILKPAVLYLPTHGSINLHASLLPAYRGAAPIQRAIAAGETTTGLTMIRMDEGMDTGPMLARRKVGILPGETAGELGERLSEQGGALVVDVLGRIEKGERKPVPQPEEGVSYAPKVKSGDARIDWTLPAEKIACLIRAFDPAPGAYCLRGGSILKLFRPTATDSSSVRMPGEVVECGNRGGVVIACGDDRSISVRELQAEGRKRLPAQEYLRGSRMKPGETLE